MMCATQLDRTLDRTRCASVVVNISTDHRPNDNNNASQQIS
jgi:hypothetical protein